MAEADDSRRHLPRLMPSARIAELLPVGPELSSLQDGWRDVVLQVFRDLPSSIDLPGLHDHTLVTHLAGPVLVEAVEGPGSFERRWINQGQVGITPCGSRVRRAFKGRPQVMLTHLKPERLGALAEDMFDLDPARVGLVPKLAATDDVVDRLTQLLLAEAKSRMPGGRLMTETLSTALMVHVLRHHSNLAPAMAKVVPGLSPGRVRRVVDYMHAHMDEALSLAELARIGGLSLSRFVRAFHSATGQPPHRFLLGIRLEKARVLLEHSELPVIEVGLQCGFGQPSHFAAMFRKATGLTPRAWRTERRR